MNPLRLSPPIFGEMKNQEKTQDLDVAVQNTSINYDTKGMTRESDCEYVTFLVSHSDIFDNIL